MPPAGAIPREALASMVDAQAQQVSPVAQRIAPVYESGTTEEDGHTDWNIPLQPGQCYLFSGVGAAGVQHLSLYLWDPREGRVATETPERPTVVLRYCPVEAGQFHLQAKTAEGYGPFAVGVFAEPAQSQAPMQPMPQQPMPMPPQPVDLSAIIDGQAAAAAAGAGRVGNFFTGTTTQGDRSEWPVALEAGRCYWFIGAGDPGIHELYLYLWDPANNRLTENRSRNNQSLIGHCPKVSGMYKVQAKVEKGKGSYQMGLYAR
jgi:hypothetical protein